MSEEKDTDLKIVLLFIIEKRGYTPYGALKGLSKGWANNWKDRLNMDIRFSTLEAILKEVGTDMMTFTKVYMHYRIFSKLPSSL